MANNSLSNARQLDGWGFNVIPAAAQGKSPLIDHKEYQDRRTSDKLSAWFTGSRAFNYWIATGLVSGIVVLDCDTAAAEAYWRDEVDIGELLDSTVCVRTRKGHHYYFGTDRHVHSWAQHDTDNPDGVHFDVRADKTGVIAPPSVHETGFQYEWVRSPDDCDLAPVPDVLIAKPKSLGGMDNTRSMLARLLADPPQTVGGRNEWLARVAGHYAKQHRSMADLYEVECLRANNMMNPPLDEAEYTKTVESIWRTEQSKDSNEGRRADEDNGWLISGGDQLLSPVRYKDQDEQWVTELKQWANFDIRVLGVMDDPDSTRTYDVEVCRKLANDCRPELLSAGQLADTRKMRAFLANLGVQVTPPPEKEIATKMVWTDRIQCYLDAQPAPHFEVVHSLGWHGDGFICHEGVITADGLRPFSNRKPEPSLRNRAPYRYGFVEIEQAKEVLREILTFHYATEASVFGSWWAACLLKPQVSAHTSQFPIMGLEAPSESGKTTGMFSLLTQLAGNAQGQTIYTPAAMRDALSAHHSGIVWVDDKDNPEPLQELMRAATSEGSFTKKAEDFSQETVRLLSPLLISGEALQLGDQKALRDRVIMLPVSPPTGRRSLHDPTRAQWDDIVELRNQYPDLTMFAGSIVQLALRSVGRVTEIQTLRGVGGKRHGDKLGILRAGARVLADMTDEPHHVDVVDRWVAEQAEGDTENTLTLKLLPMALALNGMPDRPVAGGNGWPVTPVFYRPEGQGVRGAGLWFNVVALAAWWSRHQNGRISVRTESYDALIQQVKAAGFDERRRVKISGDETNKPTYWRVPSPLADEILARALGADGPETAERLFPGQGAGTGGQGTPGI